MKRTRTSEWKANPLTALILFLLIGSGTALSQFSPFQFLQKPGPYPVGLKVVNQYDPSRKFPATPDRPEAQGARKPPSADAHLVSSAAKQ